LKQLNPDVVYKLKHYRDESDERCEEEINLWQPRVLNVITQTQIC
jgi:hypothetical protein